MGAPFNRISPAAGRSPKSARINSRCPLPWIPPSPTISPAATVKETSSKYPEHDNLLTSSRVGGKRPSDFDYLPLTDAQFADFAAQIEVNTESPEDRRGAMRHLSTIDE